MPKTETAKHIGEITIGAGASVGVIGQYWFDMFEVFINPLLGAIVAGLTVWLLLLRIRAAKKELK